LSSSSPLILYYLIYRDDRHPMLGRLSRIRVSFILFFLGCTRYYWGYVKCHQISSAKSLLHKLTAKFLTLAEPICTFYVLSSAWNIIKRIVSSAGCPFRYYSDYCEIWFLKIMVDQFVFFSLHVTLCGVATILRRLNRCCIIASRFAPRYALFILSNSHTHSHTHCFTSCKSINISHTCIHHTHTHIHRP
jgi:hypothetical protein